MLRFFRLREEVKYISTVTSSPFHKLKSRQAGLFPLVWLDVYCVNMLYYWIAFVIDQTMSEDIVDADKRYILLKVFDSSITLTGGKGSEAMRRVAYDDCALRRLVLADLKKVASLYLSQSKSGFMIDPDYRSSLVEHGRLSPMSTDDKLVMESDFEIFIGKCIGRRMRIVMAMNSDRGYASGL